MREYMGVINDTIKGLHSKRKNKQKRVYSDTIYTFDIETTSLFLLDGEWTVFDYSRPKEDYSHEDTEIIAVPYIWQFGIEDTIYFGRDFMDFESILLQLSDETIRKIIWIHNLQFELQFLENIFEKYTIVDMCARDIRKPISFVIEELNIEFRCSYMLTNLSLEKASQEYTTVEKLHTLNYDNKVRLECSTLTKAELDYCEYDCICLYNIIKYYKKRYGGHLCNIPTVRQRTVLPRTRDHLRHSLTQTFCILTDEHVRANGHGLLMLGIIVQSDTGNAIEGSLLGHVARICDYTLCMSRQPPKLEIT